MADFELDGLLSLDSSDLVSGSDEAAESLDSLTETSDETNDSLFDLDAGGAAAGGALAGLGTGAQAALDDTQELREELGRTAASLELTTEETQDLATDLSNATFPIEDVSGTLDVLAQAGVDGEESLKETANAADLVADATGNSATEIADNAVPALRAMGGDAEDLTEQMDTFTFIARETTMSVDDFSRMVTKTGPEIQELGLGVEETASIMAALEARGMDSRTAMREFRQAANKAEGDQGALMESLGLSNEELEAQQTALENAQGSTEEHAAAANESLSAMDELRAGFDDVKLAAGDMLGPVSAAVPAIQSAGIAALTLSTINFSAVVPSLAAVSAAALPITAVVLGLAAAAAVLYKAWDSNFLGIQNITEDALGELGEGFEWFRDTADESLSWILDKVAAIPEVMADVIEKIPGVDAEDVIGDVEDLEADLFPPKPDVESEGESVGESMGESMTGSLQETTPSSAELASMDLGGSDGTPMSDATTTGGESGSSPSTESSATSGGAVGGLSASDIREALEGMALDILDGEIDITGDNATIQDVRAELRRAGREAENRGIR